MRIKGSWTGAVKISYDFESTDTDLNRLNEILNNFDDSVREILEEEFDTYVEVSDSTTEAFREVSQDDEASE